LGSDSRDAAPLGDTCSLSCDATEAEDGSNDRNNKKAMASFSMAGFLLWSVNQFSDFLLAFAKLLLQMAKQFLFLPFTVIHVVISKLGELLP
jgi:hypothetical protein